MKKNTGKHCSPLLENRWVAGFSKNIFAGANNACALFSFGHPVFELNLNSVSDINEISILFLHNLVDFFYKRSW